MEYLSSRLNLQYSLNSPSHRFSSISKKKAIGMWTRAETITKQRKLQWHLLFCFVIFKIPGKRGSWSTLWHTYSTRNGKRIWGNIAARFHWNWDRNACVHWGGVGCTPSRGNYFTQHSVLNEKLFTGNVDGNVYSLQRVQLAGYQNPLLFQFSD